MISQFLKRKEEARDGWVKALTSGRFCQTPYVLKSQDGWSALGVACEVYQTLERRVLNNWEDQTELPRVVQSWLGLRTPHGEYGGTSLLYQNETGVRFATLAKTILFEPRGLFVEQTKDEIITERIFLKKAVKKNYHKFYYYNH